MGQQRLHSFLKKAYEEIGKAQVWNVAQPANKFSVDIAYFGSPQRNYCHNED
ncbi:hypothetical protein ACOWPH_30950 (plasmid) [Anabaena sp. PCC 7938]|uniref:hypothetical protein n=1 Tax=Anabaena TaxID=1163 RepID=UPI001F558867|nr:MULTISPECIES: hypothetical protein [Anabaena]MCM2409290.1 hypothetical protein [Anabaena sp. CCAP 1446/1C]